MIDLPFANPSEIGPAKEEKRFGHVPKGTGRYHMPLLPGEEGTKAGGNYVPRGVQRMTNLVGAFEDTRALSIWEQGMGLIGMALAQELYEELVLLVAQAQREGVDFERLRDYSELKEALAGHVHRQDISERSIIGRAKEIAKANAAARRGTNRHAAWEHFGETGELIGTEDIQKSTLRTAELLAEAGLQLVPGLQERVVRNVQFGAAGKFDNVLLEMRTGRLLMGDLKTKATAFYSWMTVDAQLAGYACSEWMLSTAMSHDGLFGPGEWYEPGPLEYVDQTEGVIMHVPSDGSPAYLRRADLENGRQVLAVARENIRLRSYGKSTERHAMSPWGQKDLEIAS